MITPARRLIPKQRQASPYERSPSRFSSLLLRGEIHTSEQAQKITELFEYLRLILPARKSSNVISQEKNLFTFWFTFEDGINLKEQMSTVQEVFKARGFSY